MRRVLSLLVLALVAGLVDCQLRFCEAAGSCRLCRDKRYSYYRCRVQEDCFPGETCDNGFCCPNVAPIVSMQNESSPDDPFPIPPASLTPSGTSRRDPTRLSQPAHTESLKQKHGETLVLHGNTLTAQSNDVEEKCPDGGEWTDRCAVDTHCMRGFVCAEGKCCKSCIQQRRQFLDKLGTAEVLGKALPRCTEDGLRYNNRQCLAGTDKCWCVSDYGRRLVDADAECETRRRKQESMEKKAARLRDELRSMRKGPCLAPRPGTCPRIRPSSDVTQMTCVCDDECPKQKKCCSIEGTGVCTAPVSSQMTLICAANEQFSACHSPCQGSCEDPTVLPCPSPTCQPGCHCQPGFIRRDGSQHSPCIARSACSAYDITSQCVDERRQYQGCGSACPISCSNRNTPRCHERCVSGCFCRVPYILENGEDPLHSRCVLPTECPLSPIVPSDSLVRPLTPARDSRFPIVPSRGYNLPSSSNNYYPTPSTNTATVIPNTNHCADQLKNYQGCGSKCPAGCNSPIPSSSCSLECVPGCYCHAPYILQDANDPQSACVLPQNCPSTIQPTLPANCADPRKEWTGCGALSCARSCSNLLGRCAAGHCSPGCICREPYVLQDPLDPSSRCVLPSECERKCDDPLKEFITCGSSCPMGCDNRHPRSCTPCQTGCYCKNGLVLMNSTDWQQGRCVRLEDCPSFTAEEKDEVTRELEGTSTTTTSTTTTTTESTTTPASTTEAIPEETITAKVEIESITTARGLMIEHAKTFKSDNYSSASSMSSQCPVTTLDVGGRSCNHDMDCPLDQRCCRSLIASLGVSPQRCSCPDPLAVWSSCGSLCPEYCGQPAKPVCSSTCNPGCGCAPGYVRARNDVAAPCIPREACESALIAANQDEPRATITELSAVPKDPFATQLMASAYLQGQIVSGRFTFTQITDKTLRISGAVDGLPPGSHALVLHQLGDVTNDCTRIGPPFLFTRNRNTPSLGDVIGSLTGGPSVFSRVVDWPVTDVIGRSIALYRFSTIEWTNRAQDERPMACATIGLANR